MLYRYDIRERVLQWERICSRGFKLSLKKGLVGRESCSVTEKIAGRGEEMRNELA